MNTPSLAGQTLLLTRQRHEADRAGLHWDYRIVAGDKAYSWATKKPMPGPGSAIILHEQPVHTSHYALSKEVVIPPGEYGAGKTTLDFVRKVTVGDHADSDHMTLHLKSGDRYLLKKLDVEKYGEKAWLFKNLAPYLEEGNSRFQHDGKRYVVNKLLEQTRTVPTTSFKVEDLKWVLDPEQVKQVNLDPERVEAANIRAPLLVGMHQGRPVVLDGAHRLAKAVRDGVEKLPGKLVTEEHLRNSVWGKRAEALYQTSDTSSIGHMGKKYSLNKVLEQTHEEPTTNFKVEDLKWILDPKFAKNVHVNSKRLEAADLSAPLLVGMWKGWPVVLDGTHRLAKAVRDGVEKLPGKLVTEEHLRNSVWEKKASMGIEKVALNALKARAMAHAAGIIPDAQWKYALRQVRDGRGSLLPPKELRQAKIKMGDLSNNTFQKAKSIDRRLAPETEFTGHVTQRDVKDITFGKIRTNSVNTKINDSIHNHPEGKKFGLYSKTPETTVVEKYPHKQAIPSGYEEYLDQSNIRRSLGNSEIKAKNISRELRMREINNPNEILSKGLLESTIRIDKFNQNSKADLGVFALRHNTQPLQRIIASKPNVVSVSKTVTKDPVKTNENLTQRTRLTYFDHAPRKFSKQAETSDPRFTPDLTPDQMQSLGVLTHKGSQYNDGDAKIGNYFGVKASLETWPDKWHNEQHPQGWFQWYRGYAAGKRTDDDERQIKRWISFKARHLGQLRKADQTLNDLSVQPKRRQALLNWGIAPGINIEKETENKMKTNKYLEKIAFLVEGITSYNVAKNKHDSENEKRYALGLPPEKTSTGRGASTFISSGVGGVAGSLASATIANKISDTLINRGRPLTHILGRAGATIAGFAGGAYAGAKGGNAAHRALFNESVEEALEKSKHRKQ